MIGFDTGRVLVLGRMGKEWISGQMFIFSNIIIIGDLLVLEIR